MFISVIGVSTSLAVWHHAFSIRLCETDANAVWASRRRKTASFKKHQGFYDQLQAVRYRGSETGCGNQLEEWKCVKKESFLLLLSHVSTAISAKDLKRHRWDFHCEDVGECSKQWIQVSGLFPIMPLCFNTFNYSFELSPKHFLCHSWGTVCIRAFLKPNTSLLPPRTEGIWGDPCCRGVSKEEENI